MRCGFDRGGEEVAGSEGFGEGEGEGFVALCEDVQELGVEEGEDVGCGVKKRRLAGGVLEEGGEVRKDGVCVGEDRALGWHGGGFQGIDELRRAEVREVAVDWGRVFYEISL